MLVCGVLLAWAFWSHYSAAAADADAKTNAAPSTLKDVSADLSKAIKEQASSITFGLDRIEPLQRVVLGNPLWRYVASLIYVLLAFIVSKIVDFIIKSRLRAWAGKTDNKWDDVVVDMADGPVRMVIFILLLNIGLQIFDWPSWVERFFAKGTIIIVAISLTYVVMRAVDALAGLWMKKLPADGDRKFNEQFVALMGKVAKGVIIIVATLMTLSNIGVDVMTALASFSVLGLALGLAAQDTVANLFGAVAVFVDKPFKIGERIKIGDLEGTVEEMGLRATRVRSLDGFLITVPNKTVGQATVTNITRRPSVKTELNYGITYDTSTEQIRRALAILEEIFKAHPQTDDVIVNFNKMLDWSLNLQVIHFWKGNDPRAAMLGIQDLNLEVKRRFEAEGIEFAFPTQTVHHRAEGAVPAPTAKHEGRPA
jgi:MscS family membrane protein